MTNKDQLKTSPGAWVKIFRNNLQGQEGNERFYKTKKVLIKIYKIYHIYCHANCLRMPDCVVFLCSSHGSTSTTSNISFQ